MKINLFTCGWCAGFCVADLLYKNWFGAIVCFVLAIANGLVYYLSNRK